MEGLLRRKEYLKTILGSHTLLEDGQHLLQRQSREANSNIGTPGLRSTHSKVNS